MSGHLGDEQLTSAVLGEGHEAREHLETCAECRDEAERAQAALVGFGESLRAEAERPEGFWAWQRNAILARVAQGTVRTRRLAWAGAMVLVILGAVWLTRPEQPAPRSPATISDWRSPTESLLRSPSDDLLRSTPRLGNFYYELQSAPQGARKRKEGNNES